MNRNRTETLDVLPFLLRTIRETVGLNQADIARNLGTTRQLIAFWESGENTPNKEHLAKWLMLVSKRLDLFRYREQITTLFFEGMLNHTIGKTDDILFKVQSYINSNSTRGKLIFDLVESGFINQLKLDAEDSEALRTYRDSINEGGEPK